MMLYCQCKLNIIFINLIAELIGPTTKYYKAKCPVILLSSLFFLCTLPPDLPPSIFYRFVCQIVIFRDTLNLELIFIKNPRFCRYKEEDVILSIKKGSFIDYD